MKIMLASISTRRSGMKGAAEELYSDYIKRAARFMLVETKVFPDEARFLEFLEASGGRTRPEVLLTDSGGQLVSSEDIARHVSKYEESGLQLLVFGVGPADGWSAKTLSLAQQLFAFGRITLPHELAAVILAEQIYRALTIRAGHPYHSGH
jgi:23S rRNA (pseudouridine1915-N3)-methyltransferase